MDSSPGAGSQGALRARNVAAVVDVLRAHGDMSQAEIARATGLSPGSVSSIVRDLGDSGRVVISSANARRQRVSWRAPAGYVVGVDVGRNQLRVLLGDLGENVLSESASLTEPAERPAVTIAKVAGQIAKARAAHAEQDLLGVCVSVAGSISAVTGEIVAPSLLPEWFGFDVAATFSEALGLPVIVENDANLGAIAEAAVGPLGEDVVYIKVDAGIGAGIVLGGRLRRGVSNTAGEIGHLSLDPNGVVCRCGNRGCLETIAAVPAIMSALDARPQPVETIGRVVEYALAGDVSCSRVLSDAGAALGVAAATLCTVINPHRIVVDGPITDAGDLVLGPLRDSMRRWAVPASADDARVVASTYGGRACAIGALTLARETFGQNSS